VTFRTTQWRTQKDSAFIAESFQPDQDQMSWVGKVRQVALLGICFVAASTMLAQGVDIRGIVSDSATGFRLTSANVFISGSAIGAVTNASGFYLIPAVPRGTIELTASCIGFQRQTRSLRVGGSEPITVNFRLTAKDVEAAEVVVQERRLTDTSTVSGSVYSLQVQEIRSVPGPAQGDIFHSISILPGVVSTADVSSKFYVRGGASDQNLILFDGMRIYNPYHAFGIFSVFDPEIAKSVDMYTGAFPAGYWGKLSSVLDIKARSGNGSRFSGSINLNSISSRLRLEGPLGEDNSFIVSGQKSLFNSALGSFVKNPPPASFYDLFLKASFGGPTGMFSIRGFVSGDDVKSDNPDEPDYFWQDQAFAASGSVLLSDRIYLEATLRGSRSEIRRDAKSSNVILPAQSILSEFALRTEFIVYTQSQSSWVGGFETSLPETEFNFKTRGGIQREESSMHPDFEIWLRWEKRFNRFRTSAGVQTDIPLLFDRGPSLQTIQPRISLMYEITPQLRAKTSFGVYTQNYVGITNEDDVISLFDGWVYLPNNLRPEEARHYVIGLEGELPFAAMASVQYYFKDYRSIALYNREKVYPTDPEYVAGTGQSYGIESLIRFASTPVDLYLAYTLAWTSVSSNGFTYSPRYDRRHSINLMAIFHPLRSVDVSLRWEFGSGYPFTQNAGDYDRLTFPNIGGDDYYLETGEGYTTLGPKNAARLPAYHRLDMSATYRFSIGPVNGNAGFVLINVYDRKNPFYVDRKTGQVTYMISFYPSATITLEM
jgi:hypothetical protein